MSVCVWVGGYVYRCVQGVYVCVCVRVHTCRQACRHAGVYCVQLLLHVCGWVLGLGGGIVGEEASKTLGVQSIAYFHIFSVALSCAVG